MTNTSTQGEPVMIFDEIDFRDGGIPWSEPVRRTSSGTRWFWIITTIAVLGVLIGLLLPAIQTPRHKPGRQMQCAGNLRQMGLGIAQYVNINNQFPPGTIDNPDLPLNRRLGWGIPILPYLDNAGYFQEHGTTLEAAERLAVDDPIFADLAKTSPSLTRCPISVSSTRSNYLAIAGLGSDAPTLPTSHPRAGIFGDDRRVTPADIKDGTSTTMMLTEAENLPGPWFAGGRATVRGLDPTHQPYIGVNRQLGGTHYGGANVLMADGSVKFVSESVDPKILEALSTIAGGEAVPADHDEW